MSHARITAEELDAARALLALAWAEDLGPDDVDVTATAVAGRTLEAAVVAREPGVLAGIEVAQLALEQRGARGERMTFADGDTFAAGAELLFVTGPAKAVLAAERTMLNLLQRLCAVATRTRAYVDAVHGTGARILDTRKTTPGMRALERHAVRCGGGHNHRFGLFDAAMVKDNHAAVAGIPTAVAAIRAAHPGIEVVVEADDAEDVTAAMDAGADVILLDNMSPAAMEVHAEAIRAHAERAGHSVQVEASGGITLETVRAVAESGVDRISIGALTHGAGTVDLGLDATLA